MRKKGGTYGNRAFIEDVLGKKVWMVDNILSFAVQCFQNQFLTLES